LRVKPVGKRSNRDGIGAVVTVSSGADKQSQMLRSGSSYLSASELVLTFGMGANPQPATIEVRWPSEQVDRVSGVPADQTVTITEGRGITSSRAFAKRSGEPIEQHRRQTAQRGSNGNTAASSNTGSQAPKH